MPPPIAARSQLGHDASGTASTHGLRARDAPPSSVSSLWSALNRRINARDGAGDADAVNAGNDADPNGTNPTFPPPATLPTSSATTTTAPAPSPTNTSGGPDPSPTNSTSTDVPQPSTSSSSSSANSTSSSTPRPSTTNTTTTRPPTNSSTTPRPSPTNNPPPANSSTTPQNTPAPSPTNTSAPVNQTSSTSTPTTTRPPEANTTAAPNTTSFVTSTSQGANGPVVVTSVVVATNTPNPNGVLNGAENDSSHSNGFFNNPGAVGGTFAAVGILLALLIASALVILRRRRRARKLADDVNIAVSAAAAHKRTPFEDDDDDDVDPLRQTSQGMSAHRAYGSMSSPGMMSAEGHPMLGSTPSSQLHAAYGPSSGQGVEYGRHSPMNSLGSMAGMTLPAAAGAAAAAAGAHHAYYDHGRPGSAAAQAYDHYYAQQPQQQQYYQQQHMGAMEGVDPHAGANPYADQGMAGTYYHRLPVDRPVISPEPGLSPEIQAYFQGQVQLPSPHAPSPIPPPLYAQQSSSASENPETRSPQQDPFNPRAATSRNSGSAGGAVSPLGEDTILDGEGMPFARRSSVRRSNNGSHSGSGSNGNRGSAIETGSLLAPPLPGTENDAPGSLLPYNQNRGSSTSTMGGGVAGGASESESSGTTAAMATATARKAAADPDARKSVRTSDGALFTISSMGEK